MSHVVVEALWAQQFSPCYPPIRISDAHHDSPKHMTPIKKIFRQTLANPMFILSGTCCPTLVRKTLMCHLLKFAPGISPLSHFILWQLHLNICDHLRFALRCWSRLAIIGQFWHFHARTIRASLPHLASWNLDITSPQFRPPSFPGKAFLRQALAKLSPNFRETSPYMLPIFFAK